MTTITFADCGLDISHNMLQAPMCTCGCGEYASLILNDDKDVSDFIGTMLCEDECEHCAIFAIKQNGDLIYGQKTTEDVICYKIQDVDAMEEISDMHKAIKFHCYGLLEQVDNDLYQIVMD